MNPPPSRTDALDNRARIIEAARTVLGTSGATPEAVKMNAVAKLAGVGQGTMYRHFPTRDHLLAAVYQRDVEELVAIVPELLSAHDPLEALNRWFDRLVDYARVKRGVLAAVEADVWQDLSAHSHGPIGEAVTTLLEAAQAEGTVRADVDATDVIILIGYLTRLDDAEWDRRARHLLDIVLSGLRADKGTPPPV